MTTRSLPLNKPKTDASLEGRPLIEVLAKDAEGGEDPDFAVPAQLDAVEDDVKEVTTDTVHAAADGAAGRRVRQRCGTRRSMAQEAFVQRTREAILAGTCDDLFVNWMEICPRKFRYGPRAEVRSPSDFYLKSIAAWVPHILWPGYVPVCPSCEKNDCVILSTAKFIPFPMVLLCLAEDRDLDTMDVRCGRCCNRFRMTNQRSLSLDRTGCVRGDYRIYRGRKIALHEDLYSYIIGRTNDQVQTVMREVNKLALQRYVSKLTAFMLTVKSQRARVESRNRYLIVQCFDRLISSSSSRPVFEIVGVAPGPLEKEVAALEQKRDFAKRASDTVIDFSQLKKAKETKKRQDVRAFLGPAKLQKLLDCGILSGRELLELSDEWDASGELPEKLVALSSKLDKRRSNEVIKFWIANVLAEKEKVKGELDKLEAELGAKREMLSRREQERAEEVNVGVVEDDARTQSEDEEKKLPTFSSPWDRSGYAARKISRHVVADVQQTHLRKEGHCELPRPLVVEEIPRQHPQGHPSTVSMSAPMVPKLEANIGFVYSQSKRGRRGGGGRGGGHAPMTIGTQPVANKFVDFRKFCRTCGHPKSHHKRGLGATKFGRSCDLGYCGRCKLPKSVHNTFGSEMGIDCVLGVEHGATEINTSAFDKMKPNSFEGTER